jgi:hypothetical protein
MGLLLSLPAMSAFAMYLMRHVRSRGPVDDVAGVVLVALFVFMGLYGILTAVRSRIVLYPDRMEVREFWRKRVLVRDQFSGWRVLTSTLIGFIPHQAGQRTVRISQIYKFDDLFKDWLAALPNLDLQENLKSQEDIANNTELGSTPEERMQKLATARRLARWLHLVAFATSLWAIAYPRPYGAAVAILACLPWAAVWAAWHYRGFLRIDMQMNDAHPDLAGLFLLPAVALTLRVLIDVNLMEWTQAIAPACIIGGILFLAAMRADPMLAPKAWSKIVLLFFALVYGLGAGLQANSLLDRSAVTTYMTRVSAKREKSLMLGAWGPKRDTTVVHVSRSVGASVKPGDTVCVDLKPGALRAS